MIGLSTLGGAARLKFDPAKLKIIADGNSFFASGSNYLSKIAALPPIAGKGFTITNAATGGETFRMMMGLDGGTGAASVDNAMDATKTNLLLVCEGTNSIFAATNARTGEQAASDATDYAAARRAYAASIGAKLLMVACTTIPREIGNSDAIVAVYNDRLNVFNTLLKNDYKAMGYDAVVDVRPGTRFDFVANTRAAFDAVADIMPEAIAVHPNDAGWDILAPKWGPVIARLPAR